ncbi:MFS transporter [Nakamurella sp. A5-74]|uniref:MFS transporter n=1 Tax=Nakamurella sp. A5-74 TaxID=3158264 RepID=A0AAU8DU06_9ACTN
MTFDSRNRTLWLLVTVELLVFLEVSILNVTLPSLGAALALGPVALAWVVNGYQVSFGGLQLATGRMVDALGARRMFEFGLVVFGAGSAMAGFAGDSTTIVAARVLQGVGAAMLLPAEMALIARLFTTEEEYRHAISVWSTMAALGAGLGTTLGGVLTDQLGWPWVFWINVPIVAVALSLTRRWLPADPERTGQATLASLNVPGMVAASSVVCSVVLAASAAFEGTAVVTLECVCLGLLGGAVLRRNQMSHPHPVLPLEALRDRRVAAGVVGSLIVGATHVPAFVVLALVLQNGAGYSPMATGLLLLPIAAVNAVTARTLLVRALRAWGPRVCFTGGLVLMSVGLAALALMIASGRIHFAWLFVPSIVFGLGLPAVFAGATMTALAAAPAHLRGAVSGVLNTAQRMGAAVAVTCALVATARTPALYDSSIVLDEGGSAWLSVLLGIALLGVLGAAIAWRAMAPEPVASRDAVTV